MAIEGRPYNIVVDGIEHWVHIHPYILDEPPTWHAVAHGKSICARKTFEEVSEWVDSYRKRKVKNPVTRKIKRHETW